MDPTLATILRELVWYPQLQPSLAVSLLRNLYREKLEELLGPNFERAGQPGAAMTALVAVGDLEGLDAYQQRLHPRQYSYEAYEQLLAYLTEHGRGDIIVRLQEHYSTRKLLALLAYYPGMRVVAQYLVEHRVTEIVLLNHAGVHPALVGAVRNDFWVNVEPLLEFYPQYASLDDLQKLIDAALLKKNFTALYRILELRPFQWAYLLPEIFYRPANAPLKEHLLSTPAIWPTLSDGGRALLMADLILVDHNYALALAVLESGPTALWKANDLLRTHLDVVIQFVEYARSHGAPAQTVATLEDWSRKLALEMENDY